MKQFHTATENRLTRYNDNPVGCIHSHGKAVVVTWERKETLEDFIENYIKVNDAKGKTYNTFSVIYSFGRKVANLYIRRTDAGNMMFEVETQTGSIAGLYGDIKLEHTVVDTQNNNAKSYTCFKGFTVFGSDYVGAPVMWFKTTWDWPITPKLMVDTIFYRINGVQGVIPLGDTDAFMDLLIECKMKAHEFHELMNVSLTLFKHALALSRYTRSLTSSYTDAFYDDFTDAVTNQSKDFAILTKLSLATSMMTKV